MMTLTFQHAPIDIVMEHSIQEDKMHSLFANIVGISFSIFAVLLGLLLKEKCISC